MKWRLPTSATTSKPSATRSLVLDIQYSSDFFKKELEKFGALENHILKTQEYEVDSMRRVTMKFNKKYGYEVRNPFNVASKIFKTSSGYAMQVTFESAVASPVLIEQVRFLPHADFEVQPLNVPEEYPLPIKTRSKDVFESSQTLKAGDKRAYITKLKKKSDVTVDDFLKYYKQKCVDLGRMEVTWVGSLGDRDTFCTETFAHECRPGAAEVFAAKIVSAPKELVVEEPLTLTVRVTNVSMESYVLKVSVNEAETRTIAINSFSPKVLLLATIRKLGSCCHFIASTLICLSIPNAGEYRS